MIRMVSLSQSISKLFRKRKFPLSSPFVLDFVDFLLSKISHEKDKKNKPVFGSGKGMFIMKAGFDDPLEDFKDYM